MHLECKALKIVVKQNDICNLRRKDYKEQALKILTLLFISFALLFSEVILAEEKSQDLSQGISREVEELKNDVLELNRDLFILEEDLLFSANTQISVFVSVDVDDLFELDSMTLKIDDKVVTNYLYTAREAGSLNKGGVQRLYIGNLTSGEHEVTAFFIGKGPSKRDFKRAVSKVIEKTENAKFVELKITGDISKEQPDFIVKVWE